MTKVDYYEVLILLKYVYLSTCVVQKVERLAAYQVVLCLSPAIKHYVMS